MDCNQAISLLRGLVEIPSLSHEEGVASVWLAEQMRAAGYDRLPMSWRRECCGRDGTRRR